MGGPIMVPGEGRFLTPDPLWAASQKPTAFNRYGLSHGNPVNLVDPDGRQPGPRDTGEDNAFLLFLSIVFGGGYQDVGWADLGNIYFAGLRQGPVVNYSADLRNPHEKVL